MSIALLLFPRPRYVAAGERERERESARARTAGLAEALPVLLPTSGILYEIRHSCSCSQDFGLRIQEGRCSLRNSGRNC
jgi:hypothetical protein